MKHKLLIAGLMMIAAPLVGLFVDATPVSAMSDEVKAQCFEEWGGVSGATVNLNDATERAKWNNSVCNPANTSTSPCVVTDLGGAGLGQLKINCPDPNNPTNPCNAATYDHKACQQQRGLICEDDDEGNCAKTAFEWCGRTEGVGIQCLFRDILTFLSVVVGIAVVVGVVIGGITYSTSQGNPAQVQKGITIITNAVIGLVLYLLLWAIIQWLIPGGVFE